MARRAIGVGRVATHRVFTRRREGARRGVEREEERLHAPKPREVVRHRRKVDATGERRAPCDRATPSDDGHGAPPRPPRRSALSTLKLAAALLEAERVEATERHALALEAWLRPRGA